MKIIHTRFDALTLAAALGAVACTGNVSLGENEEGSQTEHGNGGAENQRNAGGAEQSAGGETSAGGAQSSTGGATSQSLSALCTGTAATEPLFTVPAALPPGDERYECVRKTASEWFILDPLFVTSHPGVMDIQLSVGAPTGPDGSFSCGEATVGEHLLFSVGGADPSLVKRPGYLFEAGDQLLFRVHTVNVTEQTINGTASLDRPCSPRASGGLEFSIPPYQEQAFCTGGSGSPPHSLTQVGVWVPPVVADFAFSRVAPGEHDGGNGCADGNELLLEGQSPGLHTTGEWQGFPPGYQVRLRIRADNPTSKIITGVAYWWER